MKIDIITLSKEEFEAKNNANSSFWESDRYYTTEEFIQEYKDFINTLFVKSMSEIDVYVSFEDIEYDINNYLKQLNELREIAVDLEDTSIIGVYVEDFQYPAECFEYIYENACEKS